MERAETLLGECERIDRGEGDSFGPGVNWNRLDRMMGLARSGSTQFRFQTDDMLSYTKARQVVVEYDPWLSGDPRTVRAVLDQVGESLRAVRIDVARLKWERWLKTLKDKSHQVILREAWPILEAAGEPLTREQISAAFRAQPDWSLLGKALAVAASPNDPTAPLRNRRKKKQGYFIPERFPHLIDPSK
jgi:hypothetical protein